MPTSKRLDEKIYRMHSGCATRHDFIIADAKDADMAFGITAPGRDRDRDRWKSLTDYRDQIREIVRQDIVDIMLLSVSNLEYFAITEGLFRNSAITPAARANDTTDIWAVRGGSYGRSRSQPFRSASIEHIKYGHLGVDCSQPALGADLGLYSITFTNDVDADRESLQAFLTFRLEAELKRFRYFLEVFNPNVDPRFASQEIGAFLNDHIVRSLAGLPLASRPLFLKLPYNGPEALEELVSYDPSLIVGILGGGAGTTLDAFQLIFDAQKHGARVALFGRKINLSEHPLSFCRLLRSIVDGEIEPREAVRVYHDALAALGIKPLRPLSKDLEITTATLSYR